jgi:hypothetical protein
MLQRGSGKDTSKPWLSQRIITYGTNRFRCFSAKRNQLPKTACPVLPEPNFSEHPLAQAIVQQVELKFDHTKQKVLKASWEKVPLQDVWFVRTETVL